MINKAYELASDSETKKIYPIVNDITFKEGI